VTGPRGTASDAPLYEIAPRDHAGPPVRRWWPAHWRALGLLAPAGLVVAAGLAAPLLFTIGVSVAAPGGLGNYGAVLRDAAVGRAMAHSALWVAFAVAVCVAGLGVAWLAHRAERQAGTRAGRRALRAVIAVLAAPVAVSAFAAGTASRMMFGAQPDSLGIGGYGPGATWLVLLVAFGWQWLGLAVIVFRAGLAGMPADLLRVARALGAGRLRRAASVALPALFPAAALVVIIVLVAAARVFELVIAAAPGAMQDQVDVVGVHLWRFGPTLGNGKSAALAVLLTAFVAVVALAGLWGLNREWPSGRAPVTQPAPPETGRGIGGRAGRLAVTLVAVAVTAAWLLPFAVLLLTSLHDPASAATGHWWSGGWGFGSWSAAFADGQLLPAIGDTAARAVTATVLLMVLAVPAAYALAWGGLPRLAVRAAVAAATVLAVVPPQAVAIPLGLGLDRLQLLGASWPLTGVYVAFALPLAVLLLRGSFASVPRAVVRAGQFDPARGAALLAVIARCGPALVAVAVLGFLYVWDDLLIGLLFGGTEAGQATLVLFGQTREFATSAGQLAAGAVLITAVPLVVVLATGRWLARGLTEGVRR
jgi:ABC-type glycerol-3-phosphate transport system permease component